MGYESFPRSVSLLTAIRNSVLFPSGSRWGPSHFPRVIPVRSPCVCPAIVLPHGIPLISACFVSRFWCVRPWLSRESRYKQPRVFHRGFYVGLLLTCVYTRCRFCYPYALLLHTRFASRSLPFTLHFLYSFTLRTVCISPRVLSGSPIRSFQHSK